MKTSSKVVMLVVTYLILTLDNILLASELVHDFKNPAFSGNGYSQHVLSINQLEVQREQKVFEDLKSAKASIWLGFSGSSSQKRLNLSQRRDARMASCGV